MVAYTYDTNDGAQNGQLYFELNRAIRRRDGGGRATALQLWGGYLYYLMSALAKLPDVSTVVYRGCPDKATVAAQYSVGRPVQWAWWRCGAPMAGQLVDQSRMSGCCTCFTSS